MKRDNLYLVTGYFKKQKLTLTNMPIEYWSGWAGDGFELYDPHWIAVILINHRHHGLKNITIDYLDYIDAKDGYASLYDLPKNETIKFVF